LASAAHPPGGRLFPARKKVEMDDDVVDDALLLALDEDPVEGLGELPDCDDNEAWCQVIEPDAEVAQ
jgi:hypothetical protein